MLTRPTLLGALLVYSLWGGTALADDVYVDLISPATCTPVSNLLTQCAIAPRTLGGTAFPTAVPLRTVVTRTLTGNCSTPYALEVTFTPAGESPVSYRYISQSQVVLLGASKQALTSVQLADSSTYTRYATFNNTCRVSLDIHWNRPDVDSTAQAQALIADLTTALQGEQTQRDNLQALVEYSTTFDFTADVLDNFHLQLSNPTMQYLREKATAASAVVTEFTANCNPRDAQGNLLVTPQERALLGKYLFSLGTLGNSDDWKNPDGTPKTVADFLDEQIARPLFEKLAAQSEAGATEQYKQAYAAAELRVQQAQARLELAKVQLASWLPPSP